MAKDAAKRLEPTFFEKLSKNEFSPALTKNLTLFCQAITNGDFRTASTIHVTLTQNHWEDLGSVFGTGLKMVAQLTKPH